MRVAFLCLDEQNRGRAVDLLRKHRPQPGEEDLRGFEWRYLWQQCTGDELATFKHGGAVNSTVFSADGRLIATASYSGTVKVWDVATRTVLKTFEGFPQDFGKNYAAFSPEGRWFAACRGEHVVVWDTSTWNQTTTLPGDAAPLMFSPDGSVLAGWGRAGLRLWNAQRWEPEAISTGAA
jgi:WD40 repeat protein